MARPPLQLYVWRNAPSLATARIVAPGNAMPSPWAAFVEGDSLPIRFSIVDDAGNYETLTGRSYVLGLGNLNLPPSAGTFTVSDGTVTTANLDYNITAADLQAVLNALNGATGPFGQQVQVTGGGGAPFTIAWQSNGAHALLTVNGQDLSPVCVTSVTHLQSGSSVQPEIQQVRIVVQPYALQPALAVSPTFVTGVLPVSSAQLATALGQNPELATFFEIVETDESGDVSRILQAPVTVNGTGLPPPASVPTGYYGSQWFAVDIVNGNSTQAVVFPQAFAAAPTRLLLSVLAPDADNETLFAMAASVTASGFTVVMNGAPSVDGYVLIVLVAP